MGIKSRRCIEGCFSKRMLPFSPHAIYFALMRYFCTAHHVGRIPFHNFKNKSTYIFIMLFTVPRSKNVMSKTALLVRR